MTTSAGRPTTALLLAVTVDLALVAAAPRAWDAFAAPSGGLPAAERAGGLVASGLLLATTVLWTYATVVLVAAALAAAWPASAPLVRAVAPRACRGLAAGALGLAVGAGPAAAAGDPVDPAPAPSGTAALDGLPLPDRPFGAGRAPAPRADPSQHPDDTPVLVRPGDTLWDIAAGRLPPGASDARVSRTWRAWWCANRDVVGPEPDLLLPGQRLTPPAADHPADERRPR